MRIELYACELCGAEHRREDRMMVVVKKFDPGRRDTGEADYFYNDLCLKCEGEICVLLERIHEKNPNKEKNNGK